MAKAKGGGAPKGNKNAAGPHKGIGRNVLGMQTYDLKSKAGRTAFQSKFPKATNSFLKKYS